MSKTFDAAACEVHLFSYFQRNKKKILLLLPIHPIKRKERWRKNRTNVAETERLRLFQISFGRYPSTKFHVGNLLLVLQMEQERANNQSINQSNSPLHRSRK